MNFNILKERGNSQSRKIVRNVLVYNDQPNVVRII